MGRLNGKFQHNIDAKGRLALPARFRKILPDTLMLVIGPDESVCVFTEEGFDEWVAAFFAKDGGYDTTNARHVALNKLLNGESMLTTLDSAGRMLIPAEMIRKAHLSKSALVVGVGDHIEVWDEQRWEDFKQESSSLRDLIYQS